MKKKLAIVILAITIAALSLTPAFAAQGQITEVNPSGIGSVNDTNDNNSQGDAKANENASNEAAGGNSAIDAGLPIDPSGSDRNTEAGGITD